MSATDSPPNLGRLVDLVARLRGPGGCPWDREQTLSDVRAYLLEEAHEAAAAIDEDDWEGLCSELGDLLFQVAFVGQLGAEAGKLTLSDSIARVHTKMVERHPHVFGEAEARDSASVRQAWERRKVAEKKGGESLLAGVSKSLPALVAAYRMTQKAAGVGFDWPNLPPVLAKLDEEVLELKEALSEQAGRQAVAAEIGDLLFTLVNLARKLDIDPEAALAQTNLKFRRRFGAIETALTGLGRSLNDTSLEEMDELWNQAKEAERSR